MKQDEIRELEWLRFYCREVQSCLGPADGDINNDILRAFVALQGVGALPKQQRVRFLEMEDERLGRGA